MKKERKTILLNWGYHRKSWVAPFNALREAFDFVYLSNIHPSLDKECYVEEPRIYWSEFGNANEILDRVSPDKVVFMALESGLGIALNTAAKKRGIPTYILQHGLYTTYEDYRAREEIWKKKDTKTVVPQTKQEFSFSSLKFLLASCTVSDLFKLFKFPWYLYLSKKEGTYYAAKNAVFPGRKPDKYICYTHKNATIHRELDRVPEHRLVYIGNPELDTYLIPSPSPKSDRPYFLHIDQALAENSFGEETVSIEAMQRFYSKINQYCKTNGAKLKIKLHPESYRSQWLPADPNIEWIRDTEDMPTLIQHARGCFGFYSTLVLPAIFWNPTVLFKSSDSDLQEVAVGMGVVQLLDLYTFEPGDIRFDKGPGRSKAFIDSYFHAEDGKSLDRLKNVLTE